MPTQTITHILKDGSRITIEVSEGGGLAGRNDSVTITPPPPPARTEPLTVPDTGPGGQKMTKRNPMWRAFNQPDIGEAAREALGVAVELGVSSTTDFFTDVENLLGKTSGTIAADARKHQAEVEATLLRDHANDNWYADTSDAELVGLASTVIFVSKKSPALVPPLLLALATDILKARQRGYTIAVLAGYRLFVFRSTPA